MRRITDEQTRTLVATFEATSNVSQSARAAGCAVPTARRLLRARGLAPSPNGGRPKRTTYPTDLGQLPDAVIARREGVTKQCVRHWRLAQDPEVPAFKA